MSCKQECPICMDDILNTNCVTTECGHTFHASCLMRSVAHQGFGCPYCRSVMAEMPEDDEDDDEVEYEDEDDRNPDDYALRGLRFLTNNLEGEEHDHEDVLEEQEDMEQEEDQEEEPIVKPTPAFIAQKLMEQGVTMEQLVKAMLKDHDEYEREEEECLRADDDLFGRLRIIISNYEEPAQEIVQPQLEPKIEHPPPRRPIMMHV